MASMNSSGTSEDVTKTTLVNLFNNGALGQMFRERFGATIKGQGRCKDAEFIAYFAPDVPEMDVVESATMKLYEGFYLETLKKELGRLDIRVSLGEAGRFSYTIRIEWARKGPKLFVYTDPPTM